MLSFDNDNDNDNDVYFTLAVVSFFVVNVTQKKMFQVYNDPEVQQFGWVSRVEHEKYSPNSNDWDIAVIKLATPLTFNDYVQPVCLPSTPVAAGTECVATGWGSTESKHQNRAYFLLL